VLFDKSIKTLSGGELQRLLCGYTLSQKADVYIFDELSNYLDISQKLLVANAIRQLLMVHNYIFVIDHDIALLDYITDEISIIYGVPGAYGVIAKPYGTSRAINIYFEGYIPCENMKFRSDRYILDDVIAMDDYISGSGKALTYPSGSVNFDLFQLKITEGTIPQTTNIIMLMGRNGMGKSTFLNYLTKKLEVNLSYKQQYTNRNLYQTNNSTVQEFLSFKLGSKLEDSLFKSDIIHPLDIDSLYDRKINEISDGELQRVEIVLCLGRDSDIYLLDEPTAFLDIEQRVNISKILKRFFIHHRKLGFIVEHDIMVAMSIGSIPHSQIITFTEIQGGAVANAPMPFNIGINEYLKDLNITCRRDHENHRPRINKMGSSLDREQKLTNKFYY
jgi:ATP-binding cassette subfamily E protein 1